MKKSRITVAVLAVAAAFVFLGGAKKSAKTSKYVASTSWVAAIAELAGVDNVDTIAPVNLKHPPEYEITPMDVLKVSEAELFMHAGYERMMKTISVAAEVDQEKVVKVRTANTIETLSKDVDLISKKVGTEAAAAKRFGEYTKMIEDSRAKIKAAGIDQKTVYVNTNLAEFAKDLGLNIAGTFGPGPLTSEQIAEIADKKFDLIIDNVHNPVAGPAAEVAPDSKILVWRNFPEKKEKNAIYKLVKANIDMLFK